MIFLLLADCPPSVQASLSSVSDRALCIVSPSCTNITCCVQVPLLNRTFEVQLALDSSYNELRTQVDKISRRQSLIGYSFGTQEVLSIQGVYKLLLVPYYILHVTLWKFSCVFQFGFFHEHFCFIEIETDYLYMI